MTNTKKKLTDPKEQGKVLKELANIERMSVKKIKPMLSKYGLYNRYKVTLVISGEMYKTEFHDSIMNYIEGKRSSGVEIFACMFRDAQCAKSVIDLQDFCVNFGYEVEDLRKAQKAYEGCKEVKKFFDKVLDEYQQDTIGELLNEWGY